tara:strand:+ start:339 stop:554 length:216 start_codon:yes stop_codon:yes gene_type:complete
MQQLYSAEQFPQLLHSFQPAGGTSDLRRAVLPHHFGDNVEGAEEYLSSHRELKSECLKLLISTRVRWSEEL